MEYKRDGLPLDVWSMEKVLTNAQIKIREIQEAGEISQGNISLSDVMKLLEIAIHGTSLINSVLMRVQPKLEGITWLENQVKLLDSEVRSQKFMIRDSNQKRRRRSRSNSRELERGRTTEIRNKSRARFEESKEKAEPLVKPEAPANSNQAKTAKPAYFRKSVRKIHKRIDLAVTVLKELDFKVRMNSELISNVTFQNSKNTSKHKSTGSLALQELSERGRSHTADQNKGNRPDRGSQSNGKKKGKGNPKKGNKKPGEQDKKPEGDQNRPQTSNQEQIVSSAKMDVEKVQKGKKTGK